MGLSRKRENSGLEQYMIREGFEVSFECGHQAVYDRQSGHGIPLVGEIGRCHQCDDMPEPNAGIDRVVSGTRQCWIETTTTVHFEKPERAPGPGAGE